ncbi:putative membrane protein [Pseudosporangium ferrugineum]|uniref:Putative membrane protein n=1 Tax=Pseudosporangium ferrugineum TaxID=439699 RepID=A0A2T0RI20_9ACTN|nr:putative membrane protein [Pseudosporangium ferrugineum]
MVIAVPAVALFCAYATASVTRHLRVRSTGFDLGIFEQGIRGYAGWGAPTAPLKGPGVHLLGDHFHPILVLLVPFYRLFPGPSTLLIAQAALLAVSAVPVTRLAIRRFGTRGGSAIGAAYGLSWGMQRAVGFDFHEICFAVPLLAFSLECLVDRRWAAAVAWAAPLILVKEDLPATVAAVGGYLILHGRRRLGGATVCGAVAAGLLIVEVLIPAFNAAHTYGYASGSAPLSGLPQKLLTVLMVLLPTGFLAVRSPILLLALPTLGWRFWSANPSYWGTEFHYSAVLMPIVFVAMLDSPPARSRRWLPAWCLAFAALLTTMLPLHALADPGTWRPDRAATATRAALHRIPDGATVAADNRLAPQLTARCEVYLFPFYPSAALRPTWVAIPDAPSNDPRSVAAREALPSLGYRPAASGEGVLLFTRSPDR